jgi:Motility quorum-sensing regulator, toxin of MqsA
MTKSRPRYRLSEIQASMTCVASMRLTNSARRGIRELGMSQQQALELIQSLTVFEFYKSMPCDGDPTNWQDVYSAQWKGIPVYVKFQEDRKKAVSPTARGPAAQAGSPEARCFVISFKEWTTEWN